jgi:hypothetical protein
MGTWRWIVGAIALPVAFFDYLENHAVAKMIEAGSAELTADLVAAASQYTVLKAGASTLAMSVALVLLLWQGARKFIPRLWASAPQRSVTR